MCKKVLLIDLLVVIVLPQGALEVIKRLLMEHGLPSCIDILFYVVDSVTSLLTLLCLGQQLKDVDSNNLEDLIGDILDLLVLGLDKLNDGDKQGRLLEWIFEVNYILIICS